MGKLINFIFGKAFQAQGTGISSQEKRRRQQRDICPKCGTFMIPIAVNKKICTYCGHVKFMF